MATTKFFRIAVEGATVDGRTIERAHLEQMAASYDPATYTARINCEHIAGYSPERPFNAYGSVLSLKTEEVELSINGAPKKLLGLYAEIDANDQLVQINRAGQKLFTSCEIHPNFVGEGKAYLVGLAVTDMPASLGTEPLKFAALSRANLFTVAEEVTIEFAAASQVDVVEAAKTGFFSALTDFFKSGTTAATNDNPPVTPPAANDNSVDVEKLAAVMGQQFAAALKPTADGLAALETRFGTMEAQLSSTEQSASFKRTPATGGANAVVTDC
jgi:hypothetical protein